MLTISMSGMAQEIYLEIKMDVYAGNIKYRSEDNIVGEEADLGEVRNISIAASAQITEHIFVKSSLATNNFNSELDIEWSNYDNSYSIDGYIRGQQIVFEFLPEIRLLKKNWLFINAGIGVVDFTRGDFYRGEATINGAAWEIEDFSGYYHHFATNIGANIQRDVVGVILEIGYRNSGSLESIRAPFRMGFRQFGAKLGVSYRLRDEKLNNLNDVEDL